MSGESRRLMVIAFCVILVCGGDALAVTLSGRVYEGSVGDESKALAGVTVTLYGSNDENQQGTDVIATTTTDPDGWYGLPVRGAYDYFNIVQTNLSGYSSEGATTVSGSVKSSDWIQYDFLALSGTTTGNKFWDKKEGGEPPVNNPPVAVDDTYGVSAGGVLNAPAPGVLGNDSDSDGDPLTAIEVSGPSNGVLVLNSDGSFTYTPDSAFSGTDSFTYTANDGLLDSNVATVTVTVDPGGEPPRDKGTLDGYKRDAETGTGLESWRIYIDLNGNGQWDAGEPSDLTDGNGYYRIADVEPGTYRVCEQMQTGWAGDEPCVEGVTVLGGVITTQDFHNRRTQPPDGTGTIRGTKFNDLNGNGQRDPGEPGLPGWQIILQDTDGNVLATATTDADGDYAFTGLEPGAYEVDEVQQLGWRQTYPEIDGGPAVWVIGLEPEATLEDIDFGNVREGTPPEYEEEHGDAPQPYSDFYLSVSSTVLLGSRVDGELAMQRDPHALGDDNDGDDDEDGVVFVTPLIPGQQATVRIDLTQVSASDWSVRGHVDFDQNGSWDAGESVIQQPLTAGAVSVVTFTVPTGALSGSTFARFYIVNTGPEPPWGLPYGEVEDYEVVVGRDGPSPDGQADVFGMCLRLEMDIPGIGLVRANLSGPAKDHVFFAGPTVGTADDSDQDGRDDLVTELVELNLQGVDPVVGAVRMHVQPTKPSTGQIEEQANNTPGILDVPPYTASGTADSFFDVYVEIELPDLGICLRSEQPIRLEGVISQVPPATSDAYSANVQTPVPLFKGPCGGGAWPVPADPDPPEALILSLNSCREAPPVGEYDFGDAPDAYKTLHTSGGPYHDTGAVMLGNFVDAEPDGQPGPLANADNDDGVFFPLGLQVDQFATVLVYVDAPSGVLVAVVGWIDYDQDGTFKDPEERFVTVNDTGAGVPKAMTETIKVPSTAKSGWTYARFRIYRTEVGVAILPSPTGYGEDGEVEDYRIEIKPKGDVPPAGHIITGIKFNDLDGDGLWEPADGEARLPNWNIWLDTNGDGQPDQTTTTDSSGGFEFPPVPPGTYTIGEQQQPGWTQTAPPAPGTRTFTVPGGPLPTISFAMFGNRRTGGRGSVTVVKKASPADDTPFDFAAHTPGGFFDVLVNKLSDPSANTWSIADLDRLQKVAELDPAGWTLTDITVTGDADHGSSIDLANATVYVDYDEGENIVIVFTNTKVPSAGQYDFGDAPVSYGNAWHTLNDNLTMGSTIDAEAGPNYSPDATGDDTHQTDDEDGVTFSDPLAWGKQVEVCVEVHNNDSSPSDVTVAGWIDFDGNGQWEPIATHIGTRSVHLPPFSIVKECWIFTVPPNAKPGDTFARFRLYRDDPNPLAIPFAVLPSGDGGEGEVEDYRVYILSDAPGPDDRLDYGDAPSPYPDASHLLGGSYLGLFGDAPDAETGMQRDAFASGDDNDADGDDENGLLSINLVKTAGAWSTWELKGYFGLSSDAKFGLWIDLNGDGDWDDLNELRATFGFCGFGAGPQDWFHALGAFQLPADAKVGATYARLRVYGDCNAAVSPSGAGGPGEVEDHLVEIKADGPGVPPGGIVHGYKWNDLNGDGQWNPNEPPLAGWTIWLDTNNSGKQDAGDMTTQTDAQGHFRFTGVPAGTYALGEQIEPGWTQTAPGGAGTYSVTVQPGQASFPQMFGNRQSGGPTTGGRICGSKWNDLNGDGAPDAAEPFLANWKMYLDLNQNGHWDTGEPFQLTDGGGSFEFTGLAVGSYTVAEEMQPGWSQTWPGGAGTHVIQIQPGMQPACVMFGNRKGGPGPGPDRTFDWGDAPDPTYPTLRTSNGAYHLIVLGFHLGQSVDGEPDGLPSPDALGDDTFGMDDEDGVAFLTPILPGDMAGLEIIASAPGYVDAWIDFDGDGNWNQPGDQILASEPVVAGSNVLSVAIPASAQLNLATFARFRLSRTGGLPPDGPAQDGEVEDYHVWLGEDGPGVPGEGPRPHVKWSQPPIEIDPNVDARPLFCGWDEPARSTQQSGSRRQWRMDADDFRCLGPIPITCIRWWGGYNGWNSPEPPDSQPQAWHIGFWANQVAGLAPDGLYLERLVWSLEIANERVHREPAGLDEFPDSFPQTCFVYEVGLEPNEWFHQAEFPSNEDVLWISITAIYPPDVEQVNMWGWKTRPHVWRDGAIMPALMGEWPTYDERLFPGRIYPIENSKLCGQSRPYDLCFELLTDEPWVKRDQPFTGIRNWPGYVDLPSQGISIRQDESIGRAVADDWLCERDTPVIAAAWWGSYIGYGYEACACEQQRESPRPDYFLLQMRTGHAEVPGEVLWEYRAYEYDEVLVGYDRHPEGEPNEPVFRYSVRLPADSWFRQRGADGTYWFSVAAVYTDPLPMILHPWGWTSHQHVFGSPALTMGGEPQATPQWQEPDSAAWPVDMSFTLFTAPQSGPIAHWRFDESEGDVAFDSAGENHGTVHGATWTEGIIEGAIGLNGLNHYVDCGASDALGPEQMTLTMWLRPEHMGGARWLLSRARTETDVDYGVERHLEGRIEFVVVPEQDGPVSVISHETTPLGEWSHVTATCDAEQLSVYINGLPDGTAACPPRPPRAGYRFVIGSLLGQTRFYNGKIDDVQLHDVRLPPEHIAEIAGN